MQSSKEYQGEIRKPSSVINATIECESRDIFKKIRDTKGIFNAKMGSIKDRNGMELTEQKILRRGGKRHRRTV